MKSTDVATAAALVSELGLLQSKLTQIPAASDVKALFGLLDGAVTLDAAALAVARQNVTDFLSVAITNVQGSLTAIGVELV